MTDFASASIDRTASPVTVQASLDEVVERARRLIATGGRRILGITGSPGAGKSTLCAALLEALGPDAVLVGMNGFHPANVELARLGRAGRKGAPDTFDVDGYISLVAASVDDGWSSVVLHSTNDDVTVKYRTAELPYLTIWRSEAAGSYALGIEPGRCWPSHVEGPRPGKVGRIVEPGEYLTTDIEITFSNTDEHESVPRPE